VTAALQPGGGILLSGDRERAVWLLRVEPAAQPPLQFGAAAALPLGGFAVPRLAAARNVDPSRRPEEDGSGQRGEFELHEPLAALEQALGDGFEDERGRVRMFGTHAVLIGQSPLRTRVEQLLRQQASQQRTVSVALKAGRVASELALRHVAGKAGADELAAALPGGAVVATLVEQPFAVTVGRELAFVRDYEVEIASKATAANPIVDSAFRGFQLRGTVHATAGALPQLTLRLLWADLAQLAAVDFTNSDLGAVDVPVSGWTDVEQRLTVRTGEWVPVHVAPDPQDPAAGSLVCLVRID
jgi:hypothetical protein